MASFDQFSVDLEAINRIKDDITNELKKRQKAASAGESTLRYDKMLQGLVERFEAHIQALEAQINENSDWQTQDKRSIIQEKRKALNIYKRQLAQFATPGKLVFGYPNNNGEAEMDDPSYKTNAELNAQTQEELKKQDNKFEVIIDTTRKIKYAGQEIAKENDVHVDLLDQLNTETDKTAENMMVVDNMLKRVMKSSNTCCLWMVVIIEILIIGVLIF